jgi:hypothetical protein
VHISLRSLYYFTGVQKIIVPCTSLRTSKEALRLARIYPGALYSTAGNNMTYVLLRVINSLVYIMCIGLDKYGNY